MKNFLKEYFTFSKTERNGILILSILLLITIPAPFFLPYFVKKEKIDFSQFEKEIAELKKSGIKIDSTEEISSPAYFPQKTQISTIELFPFNPNTATFDDWKKLGVREKTIKTIQNYISKGGKFFKKEDLKKIYGFSKEDYSRLENYITIGKKETVEKYEIRNEKDDKKPETSYQKQETTKYKPPTTSFTIDINTADSAEWAKLKGIGEKLSSRIVKYRNNLGGFVEIKQVSEVYGIDSVLFLQIKPQLALGNLSITKININTAEWKELAKHPYIRGEIASQIIGYRNFEGDFKSVAELKKLSVFTDEKLHKLEPYLTVN